MNQEAHSNIEGWNNKKYWFKKLAKMEKKTTIKRIRRIWYVNMIKEDEIIKKTILKTILNKINRIQKNEDQI
jgi:hypothetical protein